VIEVNRDGERYEVTVSDVCAAPAEVVYDLLADLEAHMEWGGSWHPSRTQRLQAMNAPPGPATVGVEFRSIGSASAGSWHDRSVVTAASRPLLFEFKTDGALRDARGYDRMSLRAVHRYELTPQADGTRITYSMVANLAVQAPPGNEHPRLPAVVFNVIVPSIIERGIRNLVRMSERTAQVKL
jgi:hypothetical protein